ncbi:hypothetical protein IFM61606_07418 [Aspergillus udagawae]|uniref:Secreted protein n=1 Tax=Aspergillus udagawae TaxID=91492 RepID=A0ABQ1A6S9_9EURO|nr:hypothetical protein IFM53868_01454 [Aspergillus udagawae]GFG27386.1 hypothetical protein IFM61606_07418 [Aspergillus udagawae]
MDAVLVIRLWIAGSPGILALEVSTQVSEDLIYDAVNIEPLIVVKLNLAVWCASATQSAHACAEPAMGVPRRGPTRYTLFGSRMSETGGFTFT